MVLSVVFFAIPGKYAFSQQDTSLLQFTGTYDFPSGGETDNARVTLENEMLFISSAIGNATLAKSGVDSFSVLGYGGIIIFLRDELGMVDRMHVQVAHINDIGRKRMPASDFFFDFTGAWLHTEQLKPCRFARN